MATEMHAALREGTGSHNFDIGNIYDEIYLFRAGGGLKNIVLCFFQFISLYVL